MTRIGTEKARSNAQRISHDDGALSHERPRKLDILGLLIISVVLTVYDTILMLSIKLSALSKCNRYTITWFSNNGAFNPARNFFIFSSQQRLLEHR